MKLRIRPVLPGEAELLSGLALRSKAHWGYPQQFIAACRHELSYVPEQIIGNSHHFVAAETEGNLSGFMRLNKSWRQSSNCMPCSWSRAISAAASGGG